MDKTTKSTITISTHNINGYARSKEYLRDSCERTPDAIRALQEHWLRPPYKKQFGVNQLRCLHPDFDGYGTSAMSKTVQAKVASGRPYGGTGFIYNKKYAKCLKPLVKLQILTEYYLSTHICHTLIHVTLTTILRNTRKLSVL